MAFDASDLSSHLGGSPATEKKDEDRELKARLPHRLEVLPLSRAPIPSVVVYHRRSVKESPV